jgi:orotidine-5'-phosphate decarboxylase
MLTSFDDKNLPPSLQGKSIRENVKVLAQSAVDCGLPSVVCSPEELSLLDTDAVYALTPGIRMPMQSFGDQKRVMGPGEAIQNGAAAIVVGRPIIEAKNAREAAMDFVTALYK